MSLQGLRNAYEHARKIAVRDARHPVGLMETPNGLCRYCGDPWVQWVGSQVDGHVKCYVPLSFKRFLVGEMKNPRLTFDLVASALGVTVSMLRAWYAAGAKVPKETPRDAT